MIAVEVYRDANGRVRGFRSRGHAEFADYGEDIVCAAVSAITQTAVLGLMRHVDVAVDVEQESGHLTCMLADDEHAADMRAQAVFETMVLGLGEVARQYPRQVRLRDVRA